MNRKNVILIAIIVLSSAVLIYGLEISRGVPAATQEHSMSMGIEIPFIDKDIDLNKGISPDIWDSVPSTEIEMEYQVMVLPWGKSLISPVTVKAFHNERDIYFYMGWKDDTEDRVLGTNRFSDASAVMFPMGDNVQNSSIILGFMSGANVWQWKASQDKEYWLKETPESGAYSDFYYPFEENETLAVSKVVPGSAVNDVFAIRAGTLTPKESQNVEGRGLWDNGMWHVVFKRSLKQADPELDARFDASGNKLVAFAVWDGAKGDRGSRKSISHDWTTFEIIPKGAAR
ncbi:Ethylbenzene dehydrogenase [Candidatus Methanoperedens nitroreducens]|uniref:Ethylbenzene dehydrogenase n=1 Tax=Candidatus Methanoperedens nitratireducens TaxID=1392998 RepID=A0A062UYU4_9EURY|nr:ethylbenzene dehydrogenase-related protein [Candidatus Methanoperedens nitroreducens]KCZ70347.1 Ethylbenzene dehydrogenase [Candidatus Methanoperedens nitroreducens]MDJ1421383.1 ethylbenzene dehydrogenase-related protein [Candidatus Methanoperedens sp.]